MSMKIIAPLAALIIAASVWAIAPAIDSEHDSNRSSIELHKLNNIDNQADLDDEIVYQASDKAKEIKAANESLKRIKG